MIQSGSLKLLLLLLFVVSLESCSNSNESRVESFEEVTQALNTSDLPIVDENEICNITDDYDTDKQYVNYTKQS